MEELGAMQAAMKTKVNQMFQQQLIVSLIRQQHVFQ
jgi:hypothetical protein